MTVPDYLEPILAWREWHVTLDNVREGSRPRARIVSPLMGTLWEPYQALEARDVNGVPCVAGLPCGCGIYAMKDPEHLYLAGSLALMRSSGGSPGVIGQVWLWGRFAEHAQGWRAQFVGPSVWRVVWAGDSGK